MMAVLISKGFIITIVTIIIIVVVVIMSTHHTAGRCHLCRVFEGDHVTTSIGTFLLKPSGVTVTCSS